MPEIIYTDTIGYPEKRNIVDIPHKDYKVEKRLNFFRVPNALYFKYYNSSNSFFLNSHYGPIKCKNLHHFFNTISFGEAPWITTFETLLPRWGKVPGWLEQKGVELMAGKDCKKLIAISECTKRIQADYLTKFPQFRETILNKTIVLHPPQKPLVSSYDDKSCDIDFIVFTFVGADFFRKGGKEVLLAFDRLLKEKAPIKLNVVSSLQYGDYASNTSIQDKEQALRIIQKHPEHINFFPKLANSEVLELLIKSHVALLPTYADTYGYFVLEAQAAGCPVITTDIRALPEINNDKCGWVIPVPKDKSGNGIINTEEARVLFSAVIEEKLYILLSEICSNPDVVKRKGAAALERIRAEHNPADVAEMLEGIYSTIYNRSI